MEHPDGSQEGVNDWENVQSDDEDNDMVVVSGGTDFPSTDQEGLPVTPPNNHQQHQNLPANTVTSSSEGGEEEELDVESGAESRIMKRLDIFSSEIVRIAHGIRRQAFCLSGFLSFTGVVAMVLAAVYGRRWIRWRRKVELDKKNQLMLLLKKKDERIKQLMFEIVRMNQILSVRRRVPAFGVIVNGLHSHIVVM